MKRAGATYAEIAAALGRTDKAIGFRWTVLRKKDEELAAIPRKRATGGQPRPTKPGGSAAERYRRAVAAANTTPLAGEVTTYTDEQGRTVTKYPRGYAHGAWPDKSARPKSGA